MARKSVVRFFDDVTGVEVAPGDVQRVSFGVDGRSYVLDLSPESRDEFREVVAPWVSAATRVRPVRKVSGPRRDLGAVRVWARENGYAVSDRGRVPKKVFDAYDAR